MSATTKPSDESDPLYFRVLGPVEIEATAQTLSLPRRRERSILGLLLLELNRTMPVDRLTELLWEGHPPDRARRAVQTHVSRIRSLLKRIGTIGVELTSCGDGYRLLADPATVDAHQFRALLERAALAGDPADRIAQLRAALTLWRGPVLEDAATGWLRDRVCADLEERRLAALEELMSDSLTLGQGRQVLPELTQLAHAQPGRERLVALHMYALHQSGRTGDALAAYQRARTYLATQLGLDPGPALRQAHQEILQGEPPDARPAGGPATSRPVTIRIGRSGTRFAARPAWRPPTPRQLPAEIDGFTGRREHLRRLEDLLPGTDTYATVAAITGTAGVGKTALAVYWAHRIAGRFPDGQLYLDLRGFAADRPLPPIEALPALLRSLGVPPRHLPTDEPAAAALYRSELAGRQVLVLLDNARSPEQIRPLLPGAAGCLVVVTSRARLTGLVARDGARQLTLGVLTAAEAHALLGGLLGAERIAAEPMAAAKLAATCSYLPLALRVAAAHFLDRPTQTIEEYVARLTPARLTTLHADGDPDCAVATSFAYSNRTFPPATARLSRSLGLLSGSDVTPPVAAALAGVPVEESSGRLGQFAGAHLLGEGAPGAESGARTGSSVSATAEVAGSWSAPMPT